MNNLSITAEKHESPELQVKQGEESARKRLYRLASDQLIQEVMSQNFLFHKKCLNNKAIKEDDLLYIRYNTETEVLEASFTSDDYWHDISLNEEFLESLAPYERVDEHATA